MLPADDVDEVTGSVEDTDDDEVAAEAGVVGEDAVALATFSLLVSSIQPSPLRSRLCSSGLSDSGSKSASVSLD